MSFPAAWFTVQHVDTSGNQRPCPASCTYTQETGGIRCGTSSSGKTLVTQLEDTFNALTFQSFLEYVLRYRTPGKLMVLVLDNARWHHAKLIQPWLFKHRHVIQLDFLPPYSPELNAIERVWKLTRKLCTHNRYFPHLDDLTQAVSQQFIAWMKPNDALRRLCAVN